MLELIGPGPDYKRAATLDINADDQLVVVAGSRSFVLGPRAGTMSGDDRPIPSFAAEPGGTAFLALERQPAGLASAIHPGGNPVERSADDLDAPSLLSLILEKGLRHITWDGLALRAGARRHIGMTR